MPTPVRKKSKGGGEKSDMWWLRKKVPQRYRGMVGRKEVWRSLDTTDKRTAIVLCAQRSAELEAEWRHRDAALRNAGAHAAAQRPVVPEATLSALQREVHERTRDAHLANPGWHLRWATLTGTPDPEREAVEREFVEQAMGEFLALTGEEFNQADRDRFLPLFAEARRRGYHDLLRAAKDKDFSPSPLLERYAPKPPKKLDFPEAFEFYCANGEIKGGTTGPTAKRWRPKIAAFCKFVGHDDLARVTTEDGYRWADHLKGRGIAPKSIRDVWIASLKATAGFMVERSKLAKNPFAGIRIRGVKGTSESNSKGFSDEQAAVILTATLATPSDLATPETRAARRWVPWACAYSGARVNEITSLLPRDVRQDPESGIWCIYIRPEMTKGDYARVVPVHSHLIDQGFLDFVETRRSLKLPLFYDPKRARGGTNANPQYEKVGERLGEWVREVLKITGVKPNHAWRHRFKSVSREVGMHPEVEKFITGHGGSDDAGKVEKVSLRYGDKWVKTLAKNIELYPRYKIAALRKPPAPLKRIRRTRAQIAADEAARRSGRSAPRSTPGLRVGA
jgi:hypothetical protein